MKEVIFSTNNKEEFVSHICETIKKQAIENIRVKSFFTLVLSGGRTPKEIFKELAKNYKESIEWSKVHLFWLDERSVNAYHDDSNYKLAYKNLISKLDVAIGSVHRIKGELEPMWAETEYEKDIKLFFKRNAIKFDFVLLGMGDDGHVASLFPNSKELNLKGKLVLATEKEYKGHYRITLSIDIINRSEFKLLMVKGRNKFNILESNDTFYPINRIKNKYIVKY